MSESPQWSRPRRPRRRVGRTRRPHSFAHKSPSRYVRASRARRRRPPPHARVGIDNKFLFASTVALDVALDVASTSVASAAAASFILRDLSGSAARARTRARNDVSRAFVDAADRSELAGGVFERVRRSLVGRAPRGDENDADGADRITCRVGLEGFETSVLCGDS